MSMLHYSRKEDKDTGVITYTPICNTELRLDTKAYWEEVVRLGKERLSSPFLVGVSDTSVEQAQVNADSGDLISLRDYRPLEHMPFHVGADLTAWVYAAIPTICGIRRPVVSGIHNTDKYTGEIIIKELGNSASYTDIFTYPHLVDWSLVSEFIEL